MQKKLYLNSICDWVCTKEGSFKTLYEEPVEMILDPEVLQKFFGLKEEVQGVSTMI